MSLRGATTIVATAGAVGALECEPARGVYEAYVWEKKAIYRDSAVLVGGV